MGGLRAVLGRGAVEVAIPAEGVRLSRLLQLLAVQEPRIASRLEQPVAGAMLRVVIDGEVVEPGLDPVVTADRAVLLLLAVAGGA